MQLNDFNWYLNETDNLSRHVLSGKLWEPHILSLITLITYLFPQGTELNMIDVGACFGWHTLHMSRFSANVLAFEPYHKAYTQLKNNIEKNGITNIQIYNVALGNETKTSYLCTASNDNLGDGFLDIGPDATHIHKSGELVKLTKQKVSCCKLDDFYIPYKVHFMKIDVQGYELMVLEGADMFLKTHRPLIAIELEDPCSLLFGYDSGDIIRKIRSYDYEIFYIESDYPSDHLGVPVEMLEQFYKIAGENIKEHTENNSINNNLNHGVVRKIELN